MGTSIYYKDQFFLRLTSGETSDLFYRLVDLIIQQGLGANRVLATFTGGCDIDSFGITHDNLDVFENNTADLELLIKLIKLILKDQKLNYFVRLKVFLVKLTLLHKSMLNNTTKKL